MVKRKTTRRKTTKRRTTTTRRTTKTKRKTTKKRKSTTSWKAKQKGGRITGHHGGNNPYKAGKHGGTSWLKKSVGKKCGVCGSAHTASSHRHHGPQSNRAVHKNVSGSTKQYSAYQNKTRRVGYKR